MYLGSIQRSCPTFLKMGGLGALKNKSIHLFQQILMTFTGNRSALTAPSLGMDVHHDIGGRL